MYIILYVLLSLGNLDKNNIQHHLVVSVAKDKGTNTILPSLFTCCYSFQNDERRSYSNSKFQTEQPRSSSIIY